MACTDRVYPFASNYIKNSPGKRKKEKSTSVDRKILRQLIEIGHTK